MKKLAAVLLLSSVMAGCAPSGYKSWDKSLPAPAVAIGDTVDDVVRNIHNKFYYRRDLGNNWSIPDKTSGGHYVGDCEDFALLVAAHLKAISVRTKIVVLRRSGTKNLKMVTKRHAMLLLPDGRYVDNQHNQPFTGTGKYSVEWVSDYL